MPRKFTNNFHTFAHIICSSCIPLFLWSRFRLSLPFLDRLKSKWIKWKWGWICIREVKLNKRKIHTQIERSWSGNRKQKWWMLWTVLTVKVKNKTKQPKILWGNNKQTMNFNISPKCVVNLFTFYRYAAHNHKKQTLILKWNGKTAPYSLEVPFHQFIKSTQLEILVFFREIWIVVVSFCLYQYIRANRLQKQRNHT